MNKLLLFISLNLFVTSIYSQSSSGKYKVSENKANDVVQRVLKQSPIIDGHNDLFVHYFDCKTCPRDLKDYKIDTIAKGHTDIPRMRKGGVGALLMNVFGRDTSINSYLHAWDLLYRMEAAHNKDLKIVGTSSELKAAMKVGKIAFLPILEGALILKNDPALLRAYYKLGLRSVTMAYKTNGLADGSDDTTRHNGISARGRVIVQEMNRLGMLVDMSHISAKAMHDILDVTMAPVMFSHSNVKALTNVNRNVPDDVLLRLKENRGIIMLTFVPYFTANEFNTWTKEGDSLYYTTLKNFPGDTTTLGQVMDKWERDTPMPIVTVSDMADHFDYVKKLIGVDHIGMAGDYDGIFYTIKGLEDVSTFPNLIMELARRGWTESELKKITGENFLRVFEEVEKKAVLLQKQMKPVLSIQNNVDVLHYNTNEKVDIYIQQQMKEQNVPGVAVAVMQNDQLIYAKSFGFSNLEHQIPAKPNTAFAITSITKSFTAIAIMQLVERGKLSLNDAIDKHLPGLPDAWKGITIKQLLNHTSGISSFTSQDKIHCTVGKQVLEYVRGDAWKEVACLPLLFAPGEKWSYGDTGYYLLGMLIEKLSGKTYEEFVQGNIFLPLEMKESRVLNYKDLIFNRADGYVFNNGKFYLAKRFEIDEFSNGGIVSTASDMIRMHYGLTTEKLLKKSTWDQILIPTKLNDGTTINYGLGFGLSPFQNKSRFGHYGGGGLGFASGLSHFPNEKLTVVILTNTDNENIASFTNTIATFYFK